MKCERCEGLVQEAQLMVTVESLEEEMGVSAWHCRNCGRIEYGTMPEKRLIQGKARVEQGLNCEAARLAA